jgi:hypothetical protein
MAGELMPVEALGFDRALQSDHRGEPGARYGKHRLGCGERALGRSQQHAPVAHHPDPPLSPPPGSASAG